MALERRGHKLSFGELSPKDSQQVVDSLINREAKNAQIICERYYEHPVLGKVKLISQFGSEDLATQQTRNQLEEHMSSATQTHLITSEKISLPLSLQSKELAVLQEIFRAA